MDIDLMDRRRLLAMLLLLPVAGCATPTGRYTIEDAVRRLLELSTQRAFARLVEPGGFYDDQLTRITPPEIGGDRAGAALAAILRTRAVRDRVALALNDLATDLADETMPLIMTSIRRMPPADLLSALRSGPTAATDLLRRQARAEVAEALLPGVVHGLRSDLLEILSAALSASRGVDYAAMAENVAGQIADAILLAIGREEAEIRRDPRATGDPALSLLLG